MWLSKIADYCLYDLLMWCKHTSILFLFLRFYLLFALKFFLIFSLYMYLLVNNLYLCLFFHFIFTITFLNNKLLSYYLLDLIKKLLFYFSLLPFFCKKGKFILKFLFMRCAFFYIASYFIFKIKASLVFFSKKFLELFEFID